MDFDKFDFSFQRSTAKPLEIKKKDNTVLETSFKAYFLPALDENGMPVMYGVMTINATNCKINETLTDAKISPKIEEGC